MGAVVQFLSVLGGWMPPCEDLRLNDKHWWGRQFWTSSWFVIFRVCFLGLFFANHVTAHAQSIGNLVGSQTGEDIAQSAIDASGFRFNDLDTTPFGPAYADIWLVQQNFLACRPPVGRPFSYALCYFSGP